MPNVNVMVPVAPAASVSGLPTVPVRLCVTVPVFVAPGGFGLEMIPLCVTEERFVTSMTRRKLPPANSAEMDAPERSKILNEVIARDSSVHDLVPLGVALPERLLSVVLVV